MHRTIAATAAVALMASATAAVSPAAADDTGTSTVNSVGYFTPDGTRGVVNLADSGAAAVVPNDKSPLVVSVGDSYISGEAGRWAGNVIAQQNYFKSDALGFEAYDDVPGAEAIDGCHRSKKAEVNFSAPDATSVNLACSGAITKSVLGSFWKPGIDFAAQTLPSGATGYGQAQLLKNLATANPGRIKMVLLSIGGNDFDFGPIVAACVQSFITFGVPCSKDPAVTAKVGDANMATQKKEIAAAIDRLLQAVGSNGAQNWTLVVQDYPSPVAPRDTNRYAENVFRWQLGGCPMYNKDLDWANSVALENIDATVQAAAEQARTTHEGARIEFLELKDALKGHRLCEQNVYAVDEPFGPVHDWRRAGAVDNSEWVQSIRILAKFATEAAIWPFKTQESLHPNYWAQLAYQNCLTQAYGDGSAISGGWCVYAGPGLDAKGRPKMTLLKAPSDSQKRLGPVRALKVKKAGARRVTVSWKKPVKAVAGTGYDYRVKAGKNWSGWLSAGSSKSVVIATTTQKKYTVAVKAQTGKAKDAPQVRFTGRGTPFSVLS